MGQKLSKSEVIERQLCTSPELWFNGKCDVSVHALASNCCEMLFGYNKNKKRSSFYKNVVAMHCSQNNLSELDVRKEIKSFYNFLKHADQDPDDIFTIDFGFNESILAIAVIDFIDLFRVSKPLTLFAYFYFLVDSHTGFANPENRDVIIDRILLPDVAGHDGIERRQYAWKCYETLRTDEYFLRTFLSAKESAR